jgi:hypothetical protein
LILKIGKRTYYLLVLLHLVVFLSATLIKSTHIHASEHHYCAVHSDCEKSNSDAVFLLGDKSCIICNLEFTQFLQDIVHINFELQPLPFFYAINKVHGGYIFIETSVSLRAPPVS